LPVTYLYEDKDVYQQIPTAKLDASAFVPQATETFQAFSLTNDAETEVFFPIPSRPLYRQILLWGCAALTGQSRALLGPSGVSLAGTLHKYFAAL